jgi:hypothetical protein
LSALAVRGLALFFLAFVLPGSRVVGLVAESRANRPALRIEATLDSRGEASSPIHVSIDVQPELGYRVADSLGRRWVMPFGRTTLGTSLPAPPWIPDLTPLAARREGELRSWLTAAGIDAEQNELARCGDADCWVLGTRHGVAQLWIDKQTLDVRLVELTARGKTEFGEWQEFGKARFPKRIAVWTGTGPFGTLTVESVAPTTIGPTDLSPEWVNSAKAERVR